MQPAISALVDEFEAAGRHGDQRAQAEVAFALAIQADRLGLTDVARSYARRCLDLAEALPANTLDDVASGRQTVGGVALPDLFHDGVVRSRLASLL